MSQQVNTLTRDSNTVAATHTFIIFHSKYVLIITSSNSFIEQPSDTGLWVAIHMRSDHLLTANYWMYGLSTAAVVVPIVVRSTILRSSWTN